MKRFSIFLIVLFSAFLGFERVNAGYYEKNGVVYDYEFIKKIILDRKNINIDNYEHVLLRTFGSTSIMIRGIFWNDSDYSVNNSYSDTKGDMYGLYVKLNSYNDAYMFIYDIGGNSLTFNKLSNSYSGAYKEFVENGFAVDIKDIETDGITFYKSVQKGVPYLDYNGEKYYLDSYDGSTENEEYTVNFHLNGGTVTIPDIEICDNIGCYIEDEFHYEDYSIKLSANDFEDYIKSLKIEKQNMRFQGFFYDKLFTNEISNNFIIDSDKDIYAKWDYEDVNDFLKNNTFNSYTFDTNYTYAVISIGKNYGQDIYLGLDFLAYNLEIYKYKKDESSQEKGSSICITPYYSKNEKYYYRIETNNIDNYNVFILPRTKLETVQNGEVINYYNFLLTDNAHVTYTNNLKNITIFDDNDNEIIIDLEDRYNYAQDALISDESNLLEIFKELLGNMNDDIFSYFNQIWNHFKSNKLYMYFMLLIAGGLVMLIIKAANRK